MKISELTVSLLESGVMHNLYSENKEPNQLHICHAANLHFLFVTYAKIRFSTDGAQVNLFPLTHCYVSHFDQSLISKKKCSLSCIK